MTDGEAVQALLAFKTQTITAGLVVWVVEKLKKSEKLPFIDQYTDKLNRFLAASLAALTAAGIQVTWNGADGSLLITGLTLSAITAFVVNAIFQFMMQQGIYHGVVKTKKKTAEEQSLGQ